MSNSQTPKNGATSNTSDFIAEIDAGTRDEIDKILDEVEQLRKELSVPSKSVRLPSEGANEFRVTETLLAEASLEETLSALPETRLERPGSPGSSGSLRSENGIDFESTFALTENVVKFPQAADASTRSTSTPASEPVDGTLSMTLSGSISLKLNYECDGQSVTVGFVDNCLRISLADGTEFKIPVGNRTASGGKKAA